MPSRPFSYSATPDPNADFHPGTPGTVTNGLQELFDKMAAEGVVQAMLPPGNIVVPKPLRLVSGIPYRISGSVGYSNARGATRLIAGPGVAGGDMISYTGPQVPAKGVVFEHVVLLANGQPVRNLLNLEPGTDEGSYPHFIRHCGFVGGSLTGQGLSLDKLEDGVIDRCQFVSCGFSWRIPEGAGTIEHSTFNRIRPQDPMPVGTVQAQTLVFVGGCAPHILVERAPPSQRSWNFQFFGTTLNCPAEDLDDWFVNRSGTQLFVLLAGGRYYRRQNPTRQSHWFAGPSPIFVVASGGVTFGGVAGTGIPPSLMDMTPGHAFETGPSVTIWGSTRPLEESNVLVQNSGSLSLSGDGRTMSFAFPHHLHSVPRWVQVQPRSPAATIPSFFAADRTQIQVNFATPPPPGSGNIVLWWKAQT